MKLGVKHRADLLKRLQEKGVPETAVDFIKRRGRICICHGTSNMKFCYLRKKETHLDPITHQWKQVEWFKLKFNESAESRVENWNQVMEQFEDWVNLIGNQ